jgi:hypothetical protein
MAISLVNALSVLCAVVTVILAVLLIYRAVLSTKEEDQLFLDAAAAHQAEEQQRLQSTLTKLSRYAMVFGALAVVLMLAILGLYTYEQLMRPPIA